MSDLSDLLRQYDNSQNVAQSLNDAFIERAKRYAESRINQGLKSRFSGSDIANEAMKSALSEVAKGNLRKVTSKNFQALLFEIVRKKVANKVRENKRPVRDFSREHECEEGVPVTITHDIAEIDVIVTELATNAAAAMLNRHVGKKNELIRLFVAALGALHNQNATDIRPALLEGFPAENVPQLRAIQKQKELDIDFMNSYLKRQLESNDGERS